MDVLYFVEEKLTLRLSELRMRLAETASLIAAEADPSEVSRLESELLALRVASSATFATLRDLSLVESDVIGRTLQARQPAGGDPMT
jgi:hypothetical protein